MIWLLCGASAAVAAPKVAVASFRLHGPASPAIQAELRRSLLLGLAQAGFDVLSDEQAALAMAKAPGLAGCDMAVCLKRMGELLGIPQLVAATVEVVGSSRYSIMLSLYRAEDGRTLVQSQDVCPVCTVKEAREFIASLAAALPAGLQKQSRPVSLRLSGHTRVLRGLAIAGWAIGGAALATGITLLSIDGQAQGQGGGKIQLLDTQAAGISLSLLAPVFATVATVSFLRATSDAQLPATASAGNSLLKFEF